MRPAKYQGSMPTTAPTVAVARTPKRLRSPLAAAKPAKGMISSEGMGGKIDSASMTRKIPRYPSSEMVWMIQSVMQFSLRRGRPHEGAGRAGYSVELCRLGGAAHSLALIGVEVHLAQTDRFWRHFDIFVIGDIAERLF